MNTRAGNQNCNDDSGIALHDLERLYGRAIELYERAQLIVERLIDAIQTSSELDGTAAELRQTCARIAELDSQISSLRRQGTGAPSAADQPLWDVATRHLAALGDLCEKVRAAENAATMQLQSLSPQLDSSIRGREMIAAYQQHRVG